jgi:RNA polymerase sigma-70 factor (ECF subfamily)
MVGRSLRSGCRDKSDFALVAATKSGENHASELLVERYQKRIFSLAYRITRNREDAQDAVQQSFQKGLMHLNSFHGKSSFSTWLTRIAINEALLCLRRKRALKEIPLEDAKSEPEGELTVEVQDRGENPEEFCQRRETEQIIHKAINQLSVEFQVVLHLWMEERPMEEVADVLGLGIGTVNTRLFRVRQKLRALVTRELEFRHGCGEVRMQIFCDGKIRLTTTSDQGATDSSDAARKKSRPVSRWRWQGGTRDVERQTSERLEVA